MRYKKRARTEGRRPHTLDGHYSSLQNQAAVLVGVHQSDVCVFLYTCGGIYT